MNKQLLLPCPFCEGKAKEDSVIDEGCKTKFVICENCGAATRGFDNYVDAINAWNRRADDAEIR